MQELSVQLQSACPALSSGVQLLWARRVPGDECTYLDCQQRNGYVLVAFSKQSPDSTVANQAVFPCR